MIYKSKTNKNYTILNNDVFKSGLSLEAIGLLSYFLSLPDNWVIYKTKLHIHLNTGKDKLDRIFKELQEKQYIISVKKINLNGTFSYEHIVYSEPLLELPCTEKPCTEKPCTEKPCTVEPFTDKPCVYKRKTTNETHTNEKEKKENDFETFWNKYPKKTAKQQCMKVFMKLKQSEIDRILETIDMYVNYKPFATYNHPNPLTYLNQKRFNDDLPIQETKPNNETQNNMHEDTPKERWLRAEYWYYDEYEKDYQKYFDICMKEKKTPEQKIPLDMFDKRIEFKASNL